MAPAPLNEHATRTLIVGCCSADEPCIDLPLRQVICGLSSLFVIRQRRQAQRQKDKLAQHVKSLEQQLAAKDKAIRDVEAAKPMVRQGSSRWGKGKASPTKSPTKALDELAARAGGEMQVAADSATAAAP